MRRLTYPIVVLALIAGGCATTAPAGTDSGSPSVADTPSSVDGSGSSACPEEGCPVPDCGDASVVRGVVGDAAQTAGDDLSRDALDWLAPIVGTADETTGLPTPSGAAAALLRRDGRDLAVAWYTQDGHGGLLRDHYVACAWAIES